MLFGVQLTGPISHWARAWWTSLLVEREDTHTQIYSHVASRRLGIGGVLLCHHHDAELPAPRRGSLICNTRAFHVCHSCMRDGTMIILQRELHAACHLHRDMNTFDSNIHLRDRLRMYGVGFPSWARPLSLARTPSPSFARSNWSTATFSLLLLVGSLSLSLSVCMYKQIYTMVYLYIYMQRYVCKMTCIYMCIYIGVYIYMNMYIQIYIHIYILMYLYIYVYIYISIYIYIYINIYICIYIYIYIHIHIHIYIYKFIYVCMYTDKYICTYINLYDNTHMHTYMYIYM